MTHNTREGIEEMITEFEEFSVAVFGSYRDEEVSWLREAIQAERQKREEELQKARESWLREEIVKLEGMKYKTSYCGYSIRSTTVDTKSAVDCINGAEKMGRNKALQTIIDRYQKELDQPNK